MADDERPRCTGRTAQGRPCRNMPLPGTSRCWAHSFRVPGRPSKLTPAIQEAIVLLVLEGNYLETAAQSVGVSERTLHRWLRRADDVEAKALEHVTDDDGPVDLYSLVDPAEWTYLDFRHALKSAQAWAETELVRTVRNYAVIGGWQAFMTILERLHPTRWGRRKVLDHRLGGALEARGKIELVIPDPAEVASVARILATAVDLDRIADENTEQEEPDAND